MVITREVASRTALLLTERSLPPSLPPPPLVFSLLRDSELCKVVIGVDADEFQDLRDYVGRLPQDSSYPELVKGMKEAAARVKAGPDPPNTLTVFSPGLRTYHLVSKVLIEATGIGRYEQRGSRHCSVSLFARPHCLVLCRPLNTAFAVLCCGASAMVTAHQYSSAHTLSWVVCDECILDGGPGPLSDLG